MQPVKEFEETMDMPTDNLVSADNVDNVDNVAADAGAAEIPSEEVKLGPAPDGSYFTPYQTTIVYSADDLFQITVATLAEHAQVIELIPGADLSTIADVCEHLSPEVVLFGSQWTVEYIESFYKRGFQFVHVMNDASTCASTCASNGAITATSICEIINEKFTRAVAFDMSEIAQHVNIVHGAIAAYLLELLMIGRCKYTPIFDNVTVSDGKWFAIGIESLAATGVHLPDKIKSICETFRGFDIIGDIIKLGYSDNQVRLKIASEKLSHAHVVIDGDNIIAYVPADALACEMLDQAKSIPHIVNNKVNILAMYIIGEHFDIELVPLNDTVDVEKFISDCYPDCLVARGPNTIRGYTAVRAVDFPWVKKHTHEFNIGAIVSNENTHNMHDESQSVLVNVKDMPPITPEEHIDFTNDA